MAGATVIVMVTGTWRQRCGRRKQRIKEEEVHSISCARKSFLTA
jgi:hypothetical protein